MDELTKKEILAMSHAAHKLTEASYQADPAKKGDAGWGNKQRTLLADMSLHLLQTSLRGDEISTEDLRRNLFSILTISDQFILDHDLKVIAEDLYSS